MLYNPEKSLGYLAALNALEKAHQQAVDAQTEQFLKSALTVSKGSVVEVAPHPKQYFSRSRRFLVLQVVSHVARDIQTKHFAGVVPSLVGVFLKDDGTAWQPIQKDKLPEGHYHTESLALEKSKYLAAPIEKLADDQSHQIEL